MHSRRSIEQLGVSAVGSTTYVQQGPGYSFGPILYTLQFSGTWWRAQIYAREIEHIEVSAGPCSGWGDNPQRRDNHHEAGVDTRSVVHVDRGSYDGHTSAIRYVIFGNTAYRLFSQWFPTSALAQPDAT